jgi:hypothetical protein
MLIRQISVFVENRPGRLSQITAVLRDAGVDIRALTLADTTDFGILRLIVNDPQRRRKRSPSAKMTVTITSVIGVRLPDVRQPLQRARGAGRRRRLGRVLQPSSAIRATTPCDSAGTKATWPSKPSRRSKSGLRFSGRRRLYQ